MGETFINVMDVFTSELNLPQNFLKNTEVTSYSISESSHTYTESIDGIKTEESTEIKSESQSVIDDGVMNETTTTTQSTTINGVADESTVTKTSTVVLDPDMNFKDILQQYSLLQNDSVNYVISGRTGNSEQQYNSKDSTSYLSSIFYDVGNRNGYLSDFISNSGVMNFIENAVDSYIRQNDYISFNMGNGTSFQAQTGNSANDIFQYSLDGENVSYAKLGYQDAINSLIYEKGVNFYSGGNFSDVLKVVESDPINIWLDGSQGVGYSNINNIDASESTGESQLVGNTSDNEIHAGSGISSLWGGNGGNDELYGGAGINTFFYGVNEGNDIIYNSASTDTVDLYNVSLSDIVSAKEIGDNLLINMLDGGSLRIVGQNGASNFILADRSQYSFNRSNQTWTQTL